MLEVGQTGPSDGLARLSAHRRYADGVVERVAVQEQLYGLREATRLCLVALFTRKHVLLEGNPGLGKTDLAKAIVRQLGFRLNEHYRRIQFTPDKLPQDLIGSEMPDRRNASANGWTFHKGPIFTWLLLADEINRASPKTQAAMLEVMAEQSVTLPSGGQDFPADPMELILADGRRAPLNPPFFVIATQNPIDQEGTYDLPEAQADRFLFKIRMPNPSRDVLMRIMEKTSGAQAGGASDHGRTASPPRFEDALRAFGEIAGFGYRGDGAAYRHYGQLQPQRDGALALVSQHIANVVEASTMLDGEDRIAFLDDSRHRAARLDELARRHKPLMEALGDRKRFERLALWTAEHMEYGLGPRAAIGLLSAVKAYGYLFEDAARPQGFAFRAFARVFHPTLRHRVKFRTAAGPGDDPVRERLIADLFRLSAPGDRAYLDTVEQVDGAYAASGEDEQ